MKDSTIQAQFGTSMRQERESKGISQEQLAQNCGLHRTYISSVERGERNLSLENIVKIATALGVTGGFLLSKADL